MAFTMSSNESVSRHTPLKRAHGTRRVPVRGVTLFVVGFLGVVLANGCGADTAGFGCTSDDECSDDLACLENQQGAVCSDGFCGCDYSQSTCTQSCTSDDDCPYDLICNRSSSCGGEPDLCGRP
jgi:hypothetical protein